ncbi:MAG: hypothetical protein K0R92_433 [Lachnospiraceae bacterium]|nr:hypothetical protein [Lachnospiraceae bacterium]
MNKRTKALQFDKKTIMKILARDEGCIFCKMNYHMDPKVTLAYMIHDPMHIVNKSQGGLGIEQNGVDGCRYHHSLLDNGNQGLRDEMIQILKDYLIRIYSDWTEESVTYNKWDNLQK